MMTLNRKAYKYLLDWKDKPGRKPLLVRGARQVGKTSLINQFGRKEFDNFIVFNLDNNRDFEELSLVKTLDDFQILIDKKGQFLDDKTLIFFDEIQNLPHLIKLLRFFYEDHPEWFVIGSGSLLEVVLKKAKISMPVGRIEFFYLYPLDFFEYLEAKNQKKLLLILKNIKVGEEISEAVHQVALELFYEYAWLGGMPEVVSSYIENKNFSLLLPIYDGLLSTYREDVYKYESTASSKYLQFVINTAPLHAGKLITYQGFGRSQYRSREMSEAFETLEKIMVLKQVIATKSCSAPLMPKYSWSKKLLFLDVGLVNYQHRIDFNKFKQQQLEDIYKGRIAEQVVGQNLLAQSTFSPMNLYYWGRPASQGSAEVDFCFNQNGKIVGVEVKTGSTSRLRSLFSFGKLVKDSFLVRVYSGCFKQEQISIDGESYPILSVPFYLVNRLAEFV